MKEKLVMITAYDYPTAKVIDEVGVDYILVGDSLAMAVLGYKDTKSVTIEEMLHHTRAVARGAKNSMIIGDMPIGTYELPNQAVKNAKLFIEAGAGAVKIEGYKPDVVKALLKTHIKVMGHLGLLPQTAPVYKVQGKDEDDAKQIMEEAKNLDTLGVIALVLECVPRDLAKKITQGVKTPTIGIGAGPDCSGQVLVLHDMLGLSDFHSKFFKQYLNLKELIAGAVTSYKSDIRTGKFPTDAHSFH